jgi:predicted aldo/keto reductase-like oxidoreductase
VAPFVSRTLGQCGLQVGPIAFGASYGMPAKAVEKAVEAGCNYLIWGSIQRDGMAQGIRALKNRRESFVLGVCSYARLPLLLTRGVEKDLRELQTGFADVLVLGYWNGGVWDYVREEAERLRDRGLIRHIALSTHRPPVAVGDAKNVASVFHLRYSAADTRVEHEVIPRLPHPRPGVVAFTATSWGRLCNPRKTPPGEATPRASDCYRFVLSNPAIDCVMTGPANEAEADEAIATIHRGPMDPDELAWMRRVGAGIRGL